MRSYPAYKDSGVEWLGAVPEGWEVARLKSLFEIRKRIAGELGHDVLSVTQKGLRVRDIDSNDGQLSMDYSKYQLVAPDDFVMNHMDLLTGYVDLSKFHGVTSPDYRVFSARSVSISLRYFLYLFQNGYHNKIFYAFGQGASEFGRWRMPTDNFNDFRVPLPPLPEQQAIARFLDKEVAKIDALVAEQRRLIALLAEKRQAVISHAVTKGLNPATPLKPSGIDWLGDIPEGWEVVPLRRLIDFIEAGTSVNATDISAGPEERGVLKTSCVYSGTFAPEENKTVIPEEFDRVSCPLIAGTLVVSRMNTPDLVGAAGYVREAPDNLFLPDRLWQVHLVDSMPEFIHFWTMTEAYRGQVKVACAGTSSSMQNLTQDDFRSFRLAVPPLDEQQAVVAHLKSDLPRFDDLTAAATSAISLLQERRAALISAAVTGKIDLRPHFAPSLSEPEIA